MDDDTIMEDVSQMPSLNKGKAKLAIDDGFTMAEDGENLPWVEKYRPVNLQDLVSHKDITCTIEHFIEHQRLPHLLFYGPPGTGKTSTILACARKLYGAKYRSMMLELNASDERGIDVVREQIKTFASMRKIFSSGFKLIVLDEADAMTNAAQAALRRVIEKYAQNVRFCIICNHVSKIIPAIQSRCTKFRFKPLDDEQIKSRIEWICHQERAELTKEGLDALLKLSQGDMRRVLNIAQATHAAFNVIDQVAVYSTTASPLPSDMQRAANWLLNEDFTTATEHLQLMKIDKGYALQDILNHVFEMVVQLQMPASCKVLLYDAFADMEYDLVLQLIGH